MGGARSTCGREEVYTVFWWGKLRERDHLGYPGIDGRIILRWDVGVWTVSRWLRIGTGGAALVNAVMNLRVP
jgi:hypothetical protein